MANKQPKQFSEETTVVSGDWFVMQKSSNDVVVKVDASNIVPNDAVTDAKLTFGKVRSRQGGNATNWAVAGSTTYDVSATNTFIQCGVIGTDTGSDATVVFPTQYTQKPVVIVSTIGGNAGGDTGITQNAFAEVIGDVSISGFSVRTFNTSAGQSNQAVSWIAIGQ